LRAIGGGAKSEWWLQIKADITGIPVAAPEITEAAGFGAALLAGVGAGIYENAASAAEKFLHFRSEFAPDISRQKIYNERFDLYKQVYPAVSPLTRRL
jgi:xylulokinase